MDTGTTLYLDLMKRILTNVIYADPPLAWQGLDPVFDADNRRFGMDWPSIAHTMIGGLRLDNLHACLDHVVADGVAGDLIETGVWRGGACIFMRAFLRAHGITDRTVWVADSFAGIPEVGPDGHPLDVEQALHEANDVLAVPEDVVRDNFARYGLLDEQVEFLPGWFRDTLPKAPIESLAVLRMDGDLYESTMDALTNLYPKVSLGGFVIVDDYALPGCRRAVLEYREEYHIDDPMRAIDMSSAYWRRGGEAPVGRARQGGGSTVIPA